MLPANKVDAANVSPLPHTYYYWYEGDQTLWYVLKEDINWDSLVRGVPTWHTEEHYFVPKELWKQVNIQKDSVSFQFRGAALSRRCTVQACDVAPRSQEIA